ncbi:chorismate mutase [Guptibacillus algicola]|uniref:chorismate mutase n=1 Tax=Guptibacillus algicola TaxID=225844 RepID=UPI001CD2CD34|nr:chorismate mutase [Alkalihalobacillus algicola]MCA0985782.1 chorismate mutase [Alkalihalobacillus algicola]
MLRGIRGATTVENNEKDEILQATEELLLQMIEQNNVNPEYVTSIQFTMTNDLNAVFPAEAVRSLKGWMHVPLLCSSEIAVEGALPSCIRVLMTVNTEINQDQIQHIYLEKAVSLRPDLVS